MRPRRAGRATIGEQPAEGAMTDVAWKRICCPVDFSEPSQAAMTYAARLAGHFDADLTLFHAYQLPGYTLPEGSVVASPKMLQELADQAEAHLAEWRKIAEQMGARGPKTAKAVGEPASEIVAFVQETHQDLLVVGTHGRTG